MLLENFLLVLFVVPLFFSYYSQVLLSCFSVCFQEMPLFSTNAVFKKKKISYGYFIRDEIMHG